MDEEEEQDRLLNPWIEEGDSEDEVYCEDNRVISAGEEAAAGLSSSSKSLLSTTLTRKRQQFLGGVDDDRLLQFVKDLELNIEIVKRETLIREASLPIIDEPYVDQNRSVSECRFHNWGHKEATAYYKKRIEPLVDTRERVWYAFRAEIIDPRDNKIQAWFIGATNYLHDDMIRIMKKMITGKSDRRINDGERTPESNKYSLFEQVGHSWYRKLLSLDFFRVTILGEESRLLNQTRSFTFNEQLQIELQCVERHNGWLQNNMVAQGRCGLNFWNPLTKRFPMKWGVSLLHLRELLDAEDFRCKNWTIIDVFERTMKPRTGECSYIEYLRRTQPQYVSEDVDWFLSPGCYNCIWYKVIFGGGIPVYAQEPKPIIKGNRFVFAELFLR